MAIVAAAVVPHSPLLLTTIAKNHYDRSAQTRTALLAVGQEFYATDPDTIIIITPHGGALPSAAAIEQGDQLGGDFRDFGDVKTTVTLSGAVHLAHRLKEAAEDADVPVLLQSRAGLDYGVMVPWLTLWPVPVHYRVLALSVASNRDEDAFRLGQVVKNFCQDRSERIGLIASGDTDRRSSEANAADRRPTKTEQRISEAIVQVDPSRLPKMPRPNLCLAEPLAVLLVCLQGVARTGEIRSFEVPVTVGQMVASFSL